MEKAAGNHITTPHTNNNGKEQIRNITGNGVKWVSTLGTDSSPSRVSPDRHPAVVRNKEKMIIGKWKFRKSKTGNGKAEFQHSGVCETR